MEDLSTLWSDEALVESFRSEIQARFEALNRAYRSRDAAELEEMFVRRPDLRGAPGFEVRDSLAWELYRASEIRIDRNEVKIVLPWGSTVDIDFLYLFDHTAVAWSRPSVGALIIDGKAHPTIEILLVATWDGVLDEKWRRDGKGRRQVLVELFEEDVRALMTTCDRPQHAACNCADYLPVDRPCRYCAGMPLRAEALLKIRDRLCAALETVP